MAINYPGYYMPQTQESALFDLGRGIDEGRLRRQEDDAGKLLAEWSDTLYGGNGGKRSPQSLSDLSALAAIDGVVNDSHVVAGAATDPMLEQYFANTRSRESGGNDAARNPKSTATGRYQFLEGTWTDLMRSHPELQLTADGRTDPAQQERAMRQFTADNARALRSAGIPINPGNLYAAHFLGSGGATNVLGQDPTSQLSAYVDPSVMSANPHLNGMTVGDFQKWVGSQGGNSRGGYQGPMVTQVADAGASAALPPRDLMRRLLANPVTRPLAVDLARSGKAQNPTADIQEYMFAVQQGYKGDFASWQTMKKSDTNVTVNNGGSSDFYKALDAKAGDQQASLLDAGRNARSNNIRLGQLEQHLSNAPQGAEGAIVQFVGGLGIPVEGLDDLQAAQALINQMVPGQRPPGSGTMSDADLALFKQSLPSIINQPGGNALIIATTKAINDYTIAQADIAEQVANREIDPAEGRRLQAAIPNPLANFGWRGGDDSGLPPGVTEDDIEETMRANNMTREQVMERLNGRP